MRDELTPLIRIYFSPPTEVGVISHLMYLIRTITYLRIFVTDFFVENDRCIREYCGL